MTAPKTESSPTPKASAAHIDTPLDPATVAPAVDGRFMSAFIRARKPA